MTDERTSCLSWLRKLFPLGKSKREKLKKATDDDSQVDPLLASPATPERLSTPTPGGSTDVQPKDAVASSGQQSTAPLSPDDPPSASATTPPVGSDAPAATKTVTPPTTTQPDQLWDQAYDDLKRDNPKLFNFYETILSLELADGSAKVEGNVIEQSDWTKRAPQMDQLLKTGLDKTEKLANVEKNIGVAINIVLSIKDAVGSALQPVPVAALAWTGLCVALNVSEPSESCLCIHSRYFRYS